MQWGKVRYLDASALVKLVVDEGDHGPIRRFFDSNVNFAATSLCLAEALGVIKAKWTHNRISEDQYFAATRELVIGAWGKRIEVDDVGLFTPQGLADDDLSSHDRVQERQDNDCNARGLRLGMNGSMIAAGAFAARWRAGGMQGA